MTSTDLKDYIKAMPEKERTCLTYGLCSLPVTVFTEAMPVNELFEALTLANHELKAEKQTLTIS